MRNGGNGNQKEDEKDNEGEEDFSDDHQINYQ